MLLVCTITMLNPRTAVRRLHSGRSGYLGGAVATQVRVNECVVHVSGRARSHGVARALSSRRATAFAAPAGVGRSCGCRQDGPEEPVKKSPQLRSAWTACLRRSRIGFATRCGQPASSAPKKCAAGAPGRGGAVSPPSRTRPGRPSDGSPACAPPKTDAGVVSTPAGGAFSRA